jgi:hypothetical protein
VIRIAITQAAFDAIASTLPLGSVGFEAEFTADGGRFIWLARLALSKLDAIRRTRRGIQPSHSPHGRDGGVEVGTEAGPTRCAAVKSRLSYDVELL